MVLEDRGSVGSAVLALSASPIAACTAFSNGVGGQGQRCKRSVDFERLANRSLHRRL